MIQFFIKYLKRSGPSLIIIGAQKAGTSSLFSLLKKSPAFCGSSKKEVHFFDRDIFYNRKFNWYHSHFDRCAPGKTKLEATPSYIYTPHVPERIYNYSRKFNNNLKFILMFREPSSRCYSTWNMFRFLNEKRAEKIYQNHVKYANEPERKAITDLLFCENYPSFEQAVKEDIKRREEGEENLEPSFVRRGFYYEQITHWLNYFILCDFLFVEIKELANPQTLYEKICEWLELDLDPLFTEKIIFAKHKGEYLAKTQPEERTLAMLKDYYRPHNEKLFQLIGTRYDWDD